MLSPLDAKAAEDPQQYFDTKYITAAQIMRLMKVTRAGLLYARRAGIIPEASVVINDGRLHIWERDIVQPYLNKWQHNMTARQEKRA